MTTEHQYVVLSGPEFDDLTFRSRALKDHPLYGLATPRLKYFEHRSCLSRGPDERVLILCLGPVDPTDEACDERDRFRAIGMLELEVAPNEADTMWFKYLTVHPDYQRQGIAKRLLEHMVAVMQATPRLLQRSSSSDEGEQKIQAYIDQLLAKHCINWRQTGR